MLGYDVHRSCVWYWPCVPECRSERQYGLHCILYPCAAAHILVGIVSFFKKWVTLVAANILIWYIRRKGFECRCGGRIRPLHRVQIGDSLQWSWHCDDSHWKGCKFHMYRVW